MKCKILKIDVEKSRLVIDGDDSYISAPHQPFEKSEYIQPIIPVLVSDEEIKEGDSFVCDFAVVDWIGFDDLDKSYLRIEDLRESYLCQHKSKCKKLITQDTEELYEDLASGKLEFNRWYEFEGLRTTTYDVFGNIGHETLLSRPLRVVEGPSNLEVIDAVIEAFPDVKFRIEGSELKVKVTPKAPTDEEIESKAAEIRKSMESLVPDKQSEELIQEAAIVMAKWLRDQMLNDKE